MNQDTIYDKPEHRPIPLVGQRIVKTSIAVFFCLMIYYLRGYSGNDMPTEAMITAIICMQPYVRDSGEFALNRLAGTMIGAFWGLMFLLMLLIFPQMGRSMPLIYARMAFGVLISLYTAVLIGKPDTASLAAIVFLCIVIAFPDIDSPIIQAGHRIIDVFVGTSVATVVNILRLPRRPGRKAADVDGHGLNALYKDGAKICLMSEHAPAFFSLQSGEIGFTTPLIVMDGAAIYDANENRYLQAETIAPADSTPVCDRLAALGVSFFIYTIHNDKTCIFHHGEIRDEERLVYDRMRRSPYRSYLEGEIYEPGEIVYVKVIAHGARLGEIEHALHSVLPKGRLRRVIRPQQGGEDLWALYIYAHTATMEQAQKRLLEMLRAADGALTGVPLTLRTPYRSERDALHLLHRVGNLYEPPLLFPAPGP